jgi:CheY-like chemotaxis protein
MLKLLLDEHISPDVANGLRRRNRSLVIHKNCEVVSATSVTEALKQIATQKFDVLITDLHMPEPGDRFSVVTAMRHSSRQRKSLPCHSAIQ